MFHVPHPRLGPEGFFCCVKGCSNFGTRKPHEVTFHKFPSNADRAKVWIDIVQENSVRSDDRDKPVTRNSIICSDHFNQRDIDRSVPSRPCIKEGAVPTLFPPPPDFLKRKHTIIRKIPVKNGSEDDGEVQITCADQSGSSAASVTSQDDMRNRPSISEVEGHVYKIIRSSDDGENSDDSTMHCDIIMDTQAEGREQPVASGTGPVKRKRGRPRARVQTVVPPTSEILYNVLVKAERFRSCLPPNWHRLVHVAGANGCVIFACYESAKQEGALPVCVREVFVDRACRVHCFIGGASVDLRALSIDDDVNTVEDVVRLLALVDTLRLCRGAFGVDECGDDAVAGAHLDLDLKWRADDCPQVLTSRRTCDGCSHIRKMFLQRVRKLKQEEPSASLEVTTDVEEVQWAGGDNLQIQHHFLLSAGDSSSQPVE